MKVSDREFKIWNDGKKVSPSLNQARCLKCLDSVVELDSLPGRVNICNDGITTMIDNPSTFCFDVLTDLVLAAHAWRVRIEISTSMPGRVRLQMHARKAEGSQFHRHPGLADLIDRASKMQQEY